MRVIAIVGDAEYLCLECASARYSGATREHGYLVGSDSEGNELGALYSWDEWQDADSPDCQALTCSQCDGVLDISHSGDCESWGDQVCTELARWVVLSYVPGYVPESEPTYVLTWGEARDALAWELDRSADQLSELPSSGDIVRAWETAIGELETLERGESWSAHLPLSSSEHDLGLAWELSRLTE